MKKKEFIPTDPNQSETIRSVTQLDIGKSQ